MSVIGKVLIVKALGVSKFTFAATVLHVPQDIIKQINQILFNFLWGCKCDKVKRDIVIQDYENGGLKMIDFTM